MRIVIDIDGDEVRVHQVIGDAIPPADVMKRAAQLRAESAGVAMLPGGVTALGAMGAEPTNAGRAPLSARGTQRSSRTTKARKSRAKRGKSKARSKASKHGQRG